MASDIDSRAEFADALAEAFINGNRTGVINTLKCQDPIEAAYLAVLIYERLSASDCVSFLELLDLSR